MEYLAEFDLVHSGNYCYMESQLPKIKAAELPLSFDFSDDSEPEYYEKIAPLVTYAFCSFDGTDDEVKKHLKKVASYGPKIVCASRGAKGCMLYANNEFFEQPAYPIEKAIDTMGAGDSYFATFLTYILRYKEPEFFKEESKDDGNVKELLKKAMQAGAEFASKICGVEGAFGYGTPIAGRIIDNRNN